MIDSVKMSYYIIDVGAGAFNEYAEWIRTRPGLEIHAIEPHPELAEALKARTKSLNVSVYQLMIGGNGVLHVANPPSCSSTLPFRMENVRRWKYPPGTTKTFCNHGVINDIPSVSISQFIEQTIPKFKQIDLLNIDVQGNTMDVLRTIDCWDRIEKIIVKVHIIDWELYQGQSKSTDVIDLLTAAGYHIVSENIISRGQEKRIIFDKTNPQQRIHVIKTNASQAAILSPPKPVRKTIGTKEVPRK